MVPSGIARLAWAFRCDQAQFARTIDPVESRLVGSHVFFSVIVDAGNIQKKNN
jgi:hypothetical protein